MLHGYLGRSYPAQGNDPIAYSSGGFLWDAALKMKKTVRDYGEFAGHMQEKEIARVSLLSAGKTVRTSRITGTLPRQSHH